jgi:hypothetical protein
MYIGDDTAAWIENLADEVEFGCIGASAARLRTGRRYEPARATSLLRCRTITYSSAQDRLLAFLPPRPFLAPRVVVDSTWHHFFDINLIGDPLALAPKNQGFKASGNGPVALDKIKRYYRNIVGGGRAGGGLALHPGLQPDRGGLFGQAIDRTWQRILNVRYRDPRRNKPPTRRGAAHDGRAAVHSAPIRGPAQRTSTRGRAAARA